MDNEIRNKLYYKTRRYYIWRTLCAGCTTFAHNRQKRTVYLLTVALFVSGATLFLWNMSPLLRAVYLPALCLLLAAGGVVGLYLLGYIPGAWAVADNLMRIGFVNGAGEPPYLIKKEAIDGQTELTFWSKGFPLNVWEGGKKSIETALDMYIAQISEGTDRRTMILHCVPTHHAFQTIHWADKLTDLDHDNRLLLGQSLIGPVVIDIDKTPHILIGGNTGSGKSVLLKVILAQMLRQQCIVYIADFKGGVDFSGWYTQAHIITKERDLLHQLDRTAEILEERKTLFLQANVRNIEEYRAKGCEIERFVVACDEVAELLDKTGADKNRKELLEKIEAHLSLIARQGRAFGIHLVLATQRPDANILTGQIRNNMNVRICGRADAVLSTIIIGDGRANEEIPKASQGRFIMEDGTVFQGYYLKD